MTWYDATEGQKETFSRKLADIYVELDRHTFKKLGRLQQDSMAEAPGIGPAFFDYDQTGKLVAHGPFEHSDDYYKALIESCIHLIKTREIATSSPTDLYLVYQTLLDHLPSQNSHGQGPPFFLQHVDTRADNYLVDDAYNITGMIDWEFSTLAPKPSAFQSPLLMHDLNLLLKEGLSVLTDDELRFSRILRERNRRNDLAVLAAQVLNFGFEQCIETNPHHWSFMQTFAAW